MHRRKILVLGTGGTIAGTSVSQSDNIGYVAGQVGVEAILQAIPGLSPSMRSRLICEQLAQLDSKDMDFAVWSCLARRCVDALDDPEIAAVVVTHGTDTLEETAWFLHAVLNAQKPVVLTSAMRPASALTPDGPQNLLDALAVADAPGAGGVLAVMAGVVHGARQVQKRYPYRVDAFGSGDAGPVGWVEEGAVRLNRPWPDSPPAPVARTAWDGSPAHFPRVEIVMSYAGACGSTVDALVRDGVRGIVVAATGNGTVHHALEAALLQAQTAGVRVVRTTRCIEGQVLSRPGDALAEVSDLSPVKARIALMLDLWSSGATQ